MGREPSEEQEIVCYGLLDARRPAPPLLRPLLMPRVRITVRLARVDGISSSSHDLLELHIGIARPACELRGRILSMPWEGDGEEKLNEE